MLFTLYKHSFVERKDATLRVDLTLLSAYHVAGPFQTLHSLL